DLAGRPAARRRPWITRRHPHEPHERRRSRPAGRLSADMAKGRGPRGSGKAGETGSGKRAGRDLAVRVRTAKGRSSSSTRWLKRQLNDPYVAAAKREGYRSRAAFKLIEIDERFHV